MSGNHHLGAFQVPLTTHLLSSFVHRYSRLWTRLGNLETSTLADRLSSVTIDRPIYVAGIARAGTTILLELLAKHNEVATHRYSDFPGQFVPYWWNNGRRAGSSAPIERAHGDRLQVTEESPEAMEEPLWMAFFDDLHNPEVDNSLGSEVANQKFEAFYRNHLKKLLLVREKSRYVAKGNYNFTRFEYLQKIFPDARFVAVIRSPRDHVASLVKQHRLFSEGERAFPRALAHMQHVGHFEFGLDRRAVNVGTGVAREAMQLWEQGEEIRGTARYWASLYGWFADRLDANNRLAEAVLVVRYEDLCLDPQTTLSRLSEHCELTASSEMRKFARQISAPSYYAPDFTERDEEIIAEETAEVAARFRYGTEVLV